MLFVQHTSSLIFLVIIVIWAAYLVQYWIRRREVLATARSVDQFTEAMRVLKRRDPLSDVITLTQDLSAHRAPSPQVSVKRPRPSLRAGTVMPGDSQHHQSILTEPLSDAHGASDKLAAVAHSAMRVGRQAATTAGSLKLRAGALIGTFALLVITVVCAPFEALPWWSVLAVLMLTGGVVVWCRQSALAAMTARETQRLKRQSRPALHQIRNVKSESVRRVMSASMDATTDRARKPVACAAVALDGSVAPPIRQYSMGTTDTVPFDVDAPIVSCAVSTPTEDVAPVATAADETPCTRSERSVFEEWQPVAIAHPAYAMKKQTERLEPVLAQMTVQAVVPAPAAAYEYVANEDLPFDGLALDQDLDELPTVYRTG